MSWFMMMILSCFYCSLLFDIIKKNIMIIWSWLANKAWFDELWILQSLGSARRCFHTDFPIDKQGILEGFSSSPIGSMYGIYANIGGILMVNVTIYSIHGSYGSWITFAIVIYYWVVHFKTQNIEDYMGNPNPIMRVILSQSLGLYGESQPYNPNPYIRSYIGSLS